MLPQKLMFLLLHFCMTAYGQQMTATLLHWKMTDGDSRQGILYKPASFDSTKQYPVIFNYYGESSDCLNCYRPPELSSGELNIPWYVSRDYLVFVPDIDIPKGHPGKGFANAVISAAAYLSRFTWVNKYKMGLQGHSFGGYGTNYIITHSSLFAAAQESCGPTDLISGYGAIRKYSGKSLQFIYERGQDNMGATPWERPDLYIESSPVLRADQITTPLLIMHNEDDNTVPFAQAIELFTALRRLKKPVWLLKYEHEGHQLLNEKNKLDFTIRQQAFFDHFLKDLPAAGWLR